MNNNESKKILALDSLRFVFVIFIAVSHMEFLVKGTYSWNFYYFWQNPLPAIDFFFILSGFGLALSTNRNPSQLPEKNSIKNLYLYAFSRTKKLFSLYLITMAIAVPLVFLERFFYGESIKKIVVMLMANIALAPTMLQSLFGATVITHGLNSVAWFFSCIFVLYGVYPLIAKVNAKVKNNKGLTVLLLLLFLALSEIAYFLLFWVDKNCTLLGLSMDLSHCSPIYRITHLIIGILLANLYELRNEKLVTGPLASVLEIVVLSISIAATLLGNRIMTGYHPFIKNFIYLVSITALVYVFAICRGCLSKVLSAGFFTGLGALAQYIFLIHNLLIMLVDKVIYHYIVPNSQINQIFVILILVCSILLSYFYSKKNKSRT